MTRRIHPLNALPTPQISSAASGPPAPASALTRRQWLASAAIPLAAAATPSPLSSASTPVPNLLAKHLPPIVDTNITLGSWPVRQPPRSDPKSLKRRLQSLGVAEAWAGTFDGLFHKDLAAANSRLVETCRLFRTHFFVPFGSVNPRLPDWREEFRRCVEVHQMPGIRLHPNYHGYRLDDPSFQHLLALASQHHVVVQLAVAMEDERMMHPLLRVDPVDTRPLVDVLRSTPKVSIVLLNAHRSLRAKPLLDLIATGQVLVDIANLEGVGGLETLLQQIPSHRLLFGSHAPLFYFESALLKLRENALKPDQLAAITHRNAQSLRKAVP